MTLINLNKARKERKRREQRANADANAVKFGRTKAERKRAEQENKRAERALDQHQKDP